MVVFFLQNQFFIKSVSYKNVLYHFHVCKSHNTLKLTGDASRINNISITMLKEIAFIKNGLGHFQQYAGDFIQQITHKKFFDYR